MAEPSRSALAVVGMEAVAAGGAGGEQGGVREYRKGNWTLHETVVLIAAKKKDEERRLKGGEKEKSRTAELRWKWIENYCWHNGCHRNQNQCNDKWDNLLRDYKKVRDYEMRQLALVQVQSTQLQPQTQSYWQLEKHERKEKGLPSNLLSQVYEALHEVVDKRYPLRPPPPAAASQSHNNAALQPPPPPPLPLPSLLQPSAQLLQQQQDIFNAPGAQVQPQPQQRQILLQQHQHQLGTGTSPSMTLPASTPSKLNLSQETPAAADSSAPTHHGDGVHPLPAAADHASLGSSHSEGSEMPASPSPAKRPRTMDKSAELGTSSVELMQALLACEERKDRRHRDLLGVEEKKLLLENTKTEISREGIAGLISAINNLATAVLSLASDKNLTS